jgi:hypothetical protein
MATISNLEERMAHVERDIEDLRSRVNGLRAKGNWIDQITGSFKDDPEFDEILRLGREIRRSDRADTE